MRLKPSEYLMPKHKKGLWSPDEDQKLAYHVKNHGHACWSSVANNAGLQRNGKSCRLRWINYLRPGLKRGAFSSQEEETILTLHGLLGNKWSQISKHLPGRTDNEIKNYWHSQLKKKLAKSEHLEVSRPVGDDMDQSVTAVSQSSHLPRLLFADWVSLDEFQQDFGMSSNQPLSYGSNYQPITTAHELQRNEGSTASSESRNCVNSCSNEDMPHTEMTIDQIFNFVGSDFYIDDFMFM